MSITSDQWTQIQNLFEQALELSESQRINLLNNSSASPDVIQEVTAMLKAHNGEPLALEKSAESLKSTFKVPTHFGSYRVIKELGKGGMSIVYLAVRDDNTFQRKVAIKTLNHVINSQAIHERFRQEQQIHARLNHPNIARLLDAGANTNGMPYLVMQYVNGQTILDYANQHIDAIEKRLALMIQVCDAIAFAHSQLILHRDIKPSNIMVDANGQIVLLDFGIAKLLQNNEKHTQNLTRDGEKLMTLSYASPEQILGQELGTASDIYSLGVVLYELLTGFRPFYGNGDYALSDTIINQDITAPVETERGQKISADLQAIILKALEKKPHNRYPSALALSDDIQRYLNHQTISVRPPNFLQKFIKFWRRNPITVPLGVMAFLSIMFSLAAALWQTHLANEQRLIANTERDRAEQVAELLLDLFDSDPYADSESRRDDITLRTFLTTRAQKMENQLSDQPELKASLFTLFANLYTNLNQLDQAEPMAVKALAMQREIHGDKHLAVAKSANILATLRQHQAKYAEAEQLFREALAIRSEILAENHPEYTNSLNNLSSLLYERGQQEDHIEMLKLDNRALIIRQKYFGPDSLPVAESLNNIASFKIQRNQGTDRSEAETMLRRAMTIRLEKLGNKHASTGNTMSNLANLLDDLGKYQEAEQLFLQALKVTESALGTSHARVAAVLYGLGQLYQDLSRWDEAHQVMARSLNINQSSFAADHPYIFDDLMELTNINLNRKNTENVEHYLTLALSFKTNNKHDIARLKQHQLSFEVLQKNINQP